MIPNGGSTVADQIPQSYASVGIVQGRWNRGTPTGASLLLAAAAADASLRRAAATVSDAGSAAPAPPLGTHPRGLVRRSAARLTARIIQRLIRWILLVTGKCCSLIMFLG